MAGYKKYNNDGPSAEDKALDLFADKLATCERAYGIAFGVEQCRQIG